VALLFLSLAIVPVSLRVAGYEVSISPSLSAAVEAWRGIAGALGNGSPSASASELSLVKKYSFAEETTTSAEEPVATEACNKSIEADFDTDFEASWISSEPAAPVAAVPPVHCKARPKASRPAAVSQRIALAGLRRMLGAELPTLVRTVAVAEARTAKCREREAGLVRVRELIRRSRALSETFKTVELQKDVQIFVKMKPIALFAGPWMTACDGEQAPFGEPATEVFPNAGPRFGVGASEEPESFEFFLDF
jgi:hypothetical protein